MASGFNLVIPSLYNIYRSSLLNETQPKPATFASERDIRNCMCKMLCTPFS